MPKTSQKRPVRPNRAETAILENIAEWAQTAQDECDDIGGWRDAAEQRKSFQGDPRREWGPMPRHFLGCTVTLSAWITDRYPKLDPTPLHEFYMAVEAWHSDHSAKRLPTQPIIQDTFTRAMFAVSSIANGFAHRQLYPEPPTAQGEEIGPKDPGVQTSGEKTALSKKAMALAALQDHPDWTDAKIADAAGCSRTTLYRWPDYKMARELLESAKATRPRGTKTKDGRVEAWPANQEE